MLIACPDFDAGTCGWRSEEEIRTDHNPYRQFLEQLTGDVGHQGVRELHSAGGTVISFLAAATNAAAPP